MTYSIVRYTGERPPHTIVCTRCGEVLASARWLDDIVRWVHECPDQRVLRVVARELGLRDVS